MKNILFIFSILVSSFLNAQHSSGEVQYTESIKLNIDMEAGNEELLKTIPKSHNISKTLVFNSNESYFKDAGSNEDLNINRERDGMDMQIVMKNPENNIYTNKEKNLLLQSKEFLGKFFLITGELNSKKWKLQADQKNILGHACQKAVLMDTSQNLVVWYALDIPVQSGPNGYANLPGLILRAELDQDARTITATKIDFRDLKKGEIIQPTKGKKMEAREFNVMQDAKMKEMGMVKGKGGAVKMIIQEERH
ncbi:MAG: GLPGLI family protein [Saprospiraceae bacterium]